MYACIGGSAATRTAAAVRGLTPRDRRSHTVAIGMDQKEVEDKIRVTNIQQGPEAGPARSTSGAPGPHRVD